MRTQMLHDLLLLLRPPLQFCQFLTMSLVARDSVLFLSTCIQAYVDGEWATVTIMSSIVAFSYIMFHFVAFRVFQWPQDEVRFCLNFCLIYVRHFALNVRFSSFLPSSA